MAKDEEKLAAKKAEKAKAKKKKAGGNKFTHFFKDLKSEINKVVWPSKKQTKNNTFAVLAFTAAAAVFICLFDFIFTSIVSLVLR